VNRPLDRDVYVPIESVKEILGHRVVLTVPATEVGSQGWPEPPIALWISAPRVTKQQAAPEGPALTPAEHRSIGTPGGPFRRPAAGRELTARTPNVGGHERSPMDNT
jgi:hypothetical protein